MVPGFSRLVVKGYRRLRDVDLELRPLNVLIGANGVGKSSLLDVLDLLAASAGAKLESSLNLLKEGLSADDADGRRWNHTGRAVAKRQSEVFITDW